MPLLGRDVVLVDALRSPFGRARPDGLYAHTRADDIAVAVVRDLLRRHPEVPASAIGEIAIAATTQQGDQGLTLGRTVGILAGLGTDIPGFAIDRMCAGALTASTLTASMIAVGAIDAAVAGGVEHMGNHPLGANFQPNPRFLAERIVAPDALTWARRPRTSTINTPPSLVSGPIPLPRRASASTPRRSRPDSSLPTSFRSASPTPNGAGAWRPRTNHPARAPRSKEWPICLPPSAPAGGSRRRRLPRSPTVPRRPCSLPRRRRRSGASPRAPGPCPTPTQGI